MSTPHPARAACCATILAGALTAACERGQNGGGVVQPVAVPTARASATASAPRNAPRLEFAPALSPSASVPPPGPVGAFDGIERVLLVSVDGLAPRYIDQLVAQGRLPTFARLEREGAWTHNARSDHGHTVTLPNHVTMITGRPVSPVSGLSPTTHHGYVSNIFPTPDETLHNAGNPALDYVPSVFDVAHDFGLRTCLYAGKDKFVIFEQSYDEDSGAPDVVGKDNGQNKIDASLIVADSSRLVKELLERQQTRPCEFIFLHLLDPDPGGHQFGWGSQAWLEILVRVDGYLGKLLDFITTDPAHQGRTALIVTADHGGTANNHGEPTDPLNYTIPFYVFGPGIPAGRDLYDAVSPERTDPGTSRPPYTAPRPPIRNGDAGNLALELLRLPPVPGTFMHGLGGAARAAPAAAP